MAKFFVPQCHRLISNLEIFDEGIEVIEVLLSHVIDDNLAFLSNQVLHSDYLEVAVREGHLLDTEKVAEPLIGPDKL